MIGRGILFGSCCQTAQAGLGWGVAETVDRPTCDRVGEPVYEPFVELETKRRARKLRRGAHEEAALSEQPQRAHDRLLFRRVVPREAANPFGYGRQKTRRLPAPPNSAWKAW